MNRMIIQQDPEEKLEGIEIEALLEHLYVINKTAKDYKGKDTKYTKDTGHSNTRINKEKREALYEMKSDILNLIKNKANKIEIHIINSEKYYCLYFNENWSFHAPKDELEILDRKIHETIVIENFHSGSRKEKTEKKLRNSLEYFNDKLNINANNYIKQPYMRDNNNQYMVGWPYLG